MPVPLKLTDLPFGTLTRIVASIPEAKHYSENDEPVHIVCSTGDWKRLNAVRASCRTLRDACRSAIVGLDCTEILSEGIENTLLKPTFHRLCQIKHTNPTALSFNELYHEHDEMRKEAWNRIIGPLPNFASHCRPPLLFIGLCTLHMSAAPHQISFAILNT